MKKDYQGHPIFPSDLSLKEVRKLHAKLGRPEHITFTTEHWRRLEKELKEGLEKDWTPEGKEYDGVTIHLTHEG